MAANNNGTRKVKTSSSKGMYASRIVAAMEAKKYNRRTMQRLTGFSYEHIRKICKGVTTLSTTCNETLCRHLDLDEAQMWQILMQEKMEAKGGFQSLQLQDVRLNELWEDLAAASRESIIKIAEGLAEMDRITAAIASASSLAEISVVFGLVVTKFEQARNLQAAQGGQLDGMPAMAARRLQAANSATAMEHSSR